MNVQTLADRQARPELVQASGHQGALLELTINGKAVYTISSWSHDKDISICVIHYLENFKGFKPQFSAYANQSFSVFSKPPTRDCQKKRL